MTAITIRFNDVEEFLDEVRRAPPTDRVVRITNRLTRTATGGQLKVVATYVTAGGTQMDPRRRQNLVEFVKHVGQLWGFDGDDDEKVLAASDKLRGGLESGVAAAGHEIRAGICTIAADTVPPFPAREFSEDLHLVRDAFQQLRQTIAAEGTARSAPLPMPSGQHEQGVADTLEQLERAIAHLETAETCAPSTILARIDATLRGQARDLEIVHRCLGRIAAHLEVPGAPVVDEVTP